jgi:hypothetical protein
MPKNFSNIQGKKYGRLLVINRHGITADRKITWLCKCDCGNEKIISGGSLRRGLTTSCGCYLSEVVRMSENKNKTHGMTKTLTWNSWASMKHRCNNIKAHDYPRYGGRGIKVCEKWLNSFEAFLADMGERPSKSHSIDRIDVNGMYEPSNCRWATLLEQGYNKRNNANITFNGVKKCVAEWAAITGIKQKAIRDRIKDGWTAEKALTTPVRIKRAAK